MPTTRRMQSEAGNAVALTLLGLAVAITAGLLVLYTIGKRAPQPVPVTREEVAPAPTEEKKDPRAGWDTYDDAAYGFSVAYPPGWIVATGTVGADPVVTITPAETATTTASYHDAETRVSVYPQGSSALAISDPAVPSSVIIAVPRASAQDYMLESKRPWATRVYFEERPSSWSDAGFVFARARIEEEEMRYVRGDVEISEDEYEASKGDSALRSGFVDPLVRETLEEVLRSFAFPTGEGAASDGGTSGSGTSTTAAARVDDLIRVSEPAEGSLVSSPLTVRGEARGQWYFESSFPAHIEASDGTVLAEVGVLAIGDWMTTEYVPFETTIAFDPGTATSGVLVLIRDNPSGLPEHDRSLRVPLWFGE